MTRKKRISEIAKEKGIPGKEFLQILKKMKVSVKTTSSLITEEEANRAIELLTKVGGIAKPAKAQTKAAAKVRKVRKPRAKKTAVEITEKPAAGPSKLKEEVKIPTEKPEAVPPEAEKAGIKEVAEKVEVKPPVEEKPVSEVKPSPPVVVRPPRVLKPLPRPPIVAVMGHVDHGKTTLLDAIRHTNVAEKEAGQITQHIGAYEVDVAVGNTTGKIVFLDTPGHEAFTAMRARGAQVTDIVVLVVAADDGVMPQTVEAIDHARAADVPIIVAINKIDKENANPEQVKQQLANYNLIPEEWGGNTICVPISALRREGLNDLLEMILLQAEILELKADPTVPATGTIIEARVDRHIGPVATVIVRQGTLRVGDSFFVGPDQDTLSSGRTGKVRALINHRGIKIDEAPPSTPVEVLGFTAVPQVGEVLKVITDKKLLKEIEESSQERAVVAPPRRFTLDDLQKEIKERKVRELKIILKTDVQGSLEALLKAFQNLGMEEVKLNVIHKGIGDIGESDVMLASASNGIIFGFNVSTTQNAQKLAQYEEVEIRTYRVIYDLISDLKKALEGMVLPKFEEVNIGRVEVLAIFRVSQVGTVAGARVLEGKIVRDAKARLIREGKIIYDGKISSLKRFKEDVKEVEKGFECGFTLEGFNDIKEHDIVQVYEMRQTGAK